MNSRPLKIYPAENGTKTNRDVQSAINKTNIVAGNPRGRQALLIEK